MACEGFKRDSCGTFLLHVHMEEDMEDTEDTEDIEDMEDTDDTDDKENMKEEDMEGRHLEAIGLEQQKAAEVHCRVLLRRYVDEAHLGHVPMVVAPAGHRVNHRPHRIALPTHDGCLQLVEQQPAPIQRGLVGLHRPEHDLCVSVRALVEPLPFLDHLGSGELHQDTAAQIERDTREHGAG